MSTNQLLPPPQERQQDQLSAQAQYAPPPPPSQAGFSLQHLVARWQAVLLEPSLAKFDAQRREANWQTVWFSLLGLAIVQAAVAIFQQAEALYWNTFVTAPPLDQFMRDMGVHNLPRLHPGVNGLEAFVNAFVGFFLLAGLVYLAAKLVGGVGTFLEHTYVLVLVYVPLQMIASGAGLFPVLGGLMAAAAAIYLLVLTVMAISAVHRLSVGTSILVAILPVILAVVAIVLVAVAVALLIAIVALILGAGGVIG